MHTGMYLHLALQSIKKNYRISLPFLGGSILMAAMFYSIASLAYNPDLGTMFGGGMINEMMSMGEKIMMLFVLIFIFYLNSVWFKARKQENGLFTILGMEKPHLIRILVYQLLFFLVASLLFGILLGICLDKIMFMLILKVSGLAPSFGFYISTQGIVDTAIEMSICYGLVLVWSVFMMLKTNPLEQLHGSQSGEKKIKNRWILALFGVLFLGAGYGLALGVKDPVSAMVWFFVAVIFVILGTYLVFMFGSTVLIQILQKNKSYYYKPNHFISVSTMKYRLKQNAAALANISILSTMVLVTLSTTTSLIAGVDTVVAKRYPTDYQVLLAANSENGLDPVGSPRSEAVLAAADGFKSASQLVEELNTAASSLDFVPENISVLMLSSLPLQTDSAASGIPGNGVVYGNVVDIQDVNRILGTSYTLAPGEVIAIGDMLKPGLQLQNENNPAQQWQVRETITKIPPQLELFMTNIASNSAVIAMDLSQSPGVQNAMLLFDADTPTNQDQALLEQFDRQGLNVRSVSWQPNEKTSFLSVYSGVLFVGIYLSLLFLLAVILIMYYKQISEGIEDQGRFKIMQNVGLEPKQIRQVINDQVLLLFFLPLGMALLHLLFAYPMIDKIMAMLQMGYTSVFLIVTAICFTVFALIYIVIYRLTARTYYRLTCLPDSQSSR